MNESMSQDSLFYILSLCSYNTCTKTIAWISLKLIQKQNFCCQIKFTYLALIFHCIVKKAFPLKGQSFSVSFYYIVDAKVLKVQIHFKLQRHPTKFRIGVFFTRSTVLLARTVFIRFTGLRVKRVFALDLFLIM